ncbi:DNA-binding protein SMUBP-2-like isoform X1 [Oopsacas minuta]|uniref:DNA helicase n=1 Tax=Oopsacas minuta TaxID=111878 RepID=A0AAV7JWY6_9METZ|nr:DNA-binding protein SMUBP-2-like isoform X1 [Oopsacas minuta]
MEEFVKKFSELLDLEQQAELAQSQQIIGQFNAKELENKGICIRKLCITGQRCGFYGRTVIKLENSKHLTQICTQNDTENSKKIFSSIFTVGDIVSIFTGTISSENPGVITHINPTSITVAFDQQPFKDNIFDDRNVSLVKVNSDVTHKRLKRALECLLDYIHSPAKHIIYVCFENTDLLPINPKYFLSNIVDGKKARVIDEFEIVIFNPQLNDVQRQAVVDALSRQDISIIHGPPGTGKTTTVVECILQFVRRSRKVLACAPSNIAVDNLLSKLAPHCRVVRLGHPARAAKELQRYTLDAQVTSSDNFEIIKQVRSEIETALGIGGKKKRKVNWAEVRELRNELHHRENAVVHEILAACDVVLSTTTSASSDGPLKTLDRNHFDVVFIDECAQVIEPGCWIPLLHAGKCVLAGDHLQLPPTIVSEEAAKSGLKITLMERLISLYGNALVSLLSIQYRMNRHIMHWPSRFLYKGKLIPHESVGNQVLSGIRHVEANCYTETPLVFIDTAGCDFHESAVSEDVSKSNEGEANLVSQYVGMLIKFGISQSEIAVIAPYSLQVELITTKLALLEVYNVEVHTVDGFQGREKEAMIISFTRSNDRGEIGFLSEVRRTNVAITRAKRHLCVIGDSITISNQRFIRGLLEYIHINGEVRSGFDFINEGITDNSVGKAEVIITEKNANQERKERPVSFLESKEKERKLSERIRKFAEDDNTENLNLHDLTSRERYIVHKVCEELGLCHSSKGIGLERKVVIGKFVNEENTTLIEPKIPKLINEDSFTDLITIQEPCIVQNDELNIETIEPNDSFVSCEICNKYIPQLNLVTHQVHCLRISQLNQKVDSAIVTVKNAPTHSKKKVKKSTNSKAKSHIVSNVKNLKKELDLKDDFTVLEAAFRLKEVCNFYKCNESTKLLGEYCVYCKLNFCLKHCQYEVHGCSNMARSDCRTSHKETCKTLPKKQRAELERKYQSKLHEKSNERKGRK